MNNDILCASLAALLPFIDEIPSHNDDKNQCVKDKTCPNCLVKFNSKQSFCSAKCCQEFKQKDRAKREGKPIESITKWLKFISIGPHDGKLLMIGKTLDSLQRNILDLINQIDSSFTFNIKAKMAYYNGQVIQLIGADDKRSEDKIRGITLAGCYSDEAILFPELFFKVLITLPTTRKTMFFGTPNQIRKGKKSYKCTDSNQNFINATAKDYNISVSYLKYIFLISRDMDEFYNTLEELKK